MPVEVRRKVRDNLVYRYVQLAGHSGGIPYLYGIIRALPGYGELYVVEKHAVVEIREKQPSAVRRERLADIREYREQHGIAVGGLVLFRVVRGFHAVHAAVPRDMPPVRAGPSRKIYYACIVGNIGGPAAERRPAVEEDTAVKPEYRHAFFGPGPDVAVIEIHAALMRYYSDDAGGVLAAPCVRGELRLGLCLEIVAVAFPETIPPQERLVEILVFWLIHFHQ